MSQRLEARLKPCATGSQSAPTSETRRTDGAPTTRAFVDDVVSSKPREKHVGAPVQFREDSIVDPV